MLILDSSVNVKEARLKTHVNLRHIKASESRRNAASRSGSYSGFGREGFTPFSVFLQTG